MYMDIQNLFQNKNEKWVLVLEDKLKSTKMIQGEGVTSYLTRLSRVRDELDVFSLTISNSYMVRIDLKEFTKEWNPFIKGIIAREKLLD